MPNTKSAERRMRNSARKQLLNRSIGTRLHSLEKKFQVTIQAGKKDDASKALQLVVSAWDKAAKTGAVPKARADRKKSRLAIQLSKLK
ncbi:MAG TPA: 30S ribosomal protein S20 [Verrucomicrobiae bacterium]|nr:30S ribosomal protein S20 [Verrucomicrobiae bacterium]